MSDHTYADTVIAAGQTWIAPQRCEIIAKWIDQVSGVAMVRVRFDDGTELVIRLTADGGE